MLKLNKIILLKICSQYSTYRLVCFQSKSYRSEAIWHIWIFSSNVPSCSFCRGIRCLTMNRSFNSDMTDDFALFFFVVCGLQHQIMDTTDNKSPSDISLLSTSCSISFLIKVVFQKQQWISSSEWKAVLLFFYLFKMIIISIIIVVKMRQVCTCLLQKYKEK